MRGVCLLLAMLLVLVISRPAQAQHPWEPSGAADSLTGCGLCHGAHASRQTVYGLRGSGTPGLATWGATLTPGSVSQSCLRCHMTASLRARQPEFRGEGGAEIERGRYLDADLTNDHPLGWLSSSEWDRADARQPDPRRDRVRARVVPPQDGGDVHLLECTTCHDPHSRTLELPSTEEQQALCSRCHDPAVYLLQDHPSLACANCHAQHGGNEVTLLAERDPDLLCSSCHDGAGIALSRRRLTTVIERGPQGHARPPSGPCITCHTMHR